VFGLLDVQRKATVQRNLLPEGDLERVNVLAGPIAAKSGWILSNTRSMRQL